MCPGVRRARTGLRQGLACRPSREAPGAGRPPSTLDCEAPHRTPDRGSLSLAATLNVAEHRHGWAAYSAAIGLALLAPIATFVAPPGATVIYVAATLGWTWTSAVMTHLYRIGSRGGG